MINLKCFKRVVLVTVTVMITMIFLLVTLIAWRLIPVKQPKVPEEPEPPLSSYNEVMSGFIPYNMSLYEYQAAKAYNISPLLLDTLCKWETGILISRGLSRDTFYLPSEGAAGRCQVLVRTALWLTGVKKVRTKRGWRWPKGTYRKMKKKLFNPQFNTLLAAHYLSLCLAKRTKVSRALYCYNAGLNNKFTGMSRYAKRILKRYAIRILERK